ncbi:hypothetical protein MTBBW1_600074 [Desulfamplus magnetovallimortis]|uniref:HPt domain-containing protein n=1 Tax=Desulfamplus magnetovallimortis TaxID=1246637 RepID=A0A1W1HIE3_9BACT|nr:Hpt domain-containing protein [Desulfamplus magnetovallimortis]SLM32244.1 hypothetical protein MTBBW1_600074 [Desulfamplus magnetovallimortis]
MKGINHHQALMRLNNKPEMLRKIFNDFKQDYADKPAMVKRLMSQGDLKEIGRIAHSVKGISGYMGAENLLKTAEYLENHIKKANPSLPHSNATTDYKNKNYFNAKTYSHGESIKAPVEKTATSDIIDTDLEQPVNSIYKGQQSSNGCIELVNNFVKELEDIIETLKQLPSSTEKTVLEKMHEYEVSCKITPDDTNHEMKKFNERRPCSKKAASNGKTITNKKIILADTEKKRLDNFTALLEKGELTAMDMLPDVEKILIKYGHNETLLKITTFIDDIEYQAAADAVTQFITASQ